MSEATKKTPQASRNAVMEQREGPPCKQESISTFALSVEMDLMNFEVKMRHMMAQLLEPVI